MWFAATGSLAGHNLRLYQDFDQTETGGDPNNLASNQLVETVSNDGLTFRPVVNPAAAGGNCAGAGPRSTASPTTKASRATRSSIRPPATCTSRTRRPTRATGPPVVQVSEGKISLGHAVTATWTESPNLDAALCPDPSCVDGARQRRSASPERTSHRSRATRPGTSTSPSPRVTSTPPGNSDRAGADLRRALTRRPPWPTRRRSDVVGPGRRLHSERTREPNTFPWITAGTDGRVDVAWYHTATTSTNGQVRRRQPDQRRVVGAARAEPQRARRIAGLPDRERERTPDQVRPDLHQRPGLRHRRRPQPRRLPAGRPSTAPARRWSPTSTTRRPTRPTARTPAREVISRQIAGPSLLASVGTITGPGAGPGQALDPVTDPSGDADYSANGTRTPGRAPTSTSRRVAWSTAPGDTLHRHDQGQEPRQPRRLARRSAAPTPVGSSAGRTSPPARPATATSTTRAWTTTARHRHADVLRRRHQLHPTARQPRRALQIPDLPADHGLSASNGSYNAATGVITFKCRWPTSATRARGPRCTA